MFNGGNVVWWLYPIECQSIFFMLGYDGLQVYNFVRLCQLHWVTSVHVGGMQVKSIQQLKHQPALVLT